MVTFVLFVTVRGQCTHSYRDICLIVQICLLIITLLYDCHSSDVKLIPLLSEK